MTHPHDFSLLNDLLDGRMGWSAAEELRRRLVEEPELGLAYDELVRLRAGLQALPGRSPPADFLAGVRARAGLPPPVAAVAAAPSVGAGGGGEGHGPSAATGNVLRLRRRFLPLAAAAGLLAGLGGFALWRLRDRVDGSPTAQSAAHRADEGTGGAREKAVPRATPPVGAAVPGEPPAPLTEGVPGSATPHFGAPGGAVPPGLRVPSDDPAKPSAAGSPVELKHTAPGLVPPSGERAAPDAASTASTAPGGMPPAPSAPASGAPSASEEPRARGARREPAMDDGTLAGGGGAGTGGADTSRDRAPGAKSSVGGGRLTWALADADDVIVLRSSGYDAARADVTLLLAAVRSGAAVEGRLQDAEHLVGGVVRDAAWKRADAGSSDGERPAGPDLDESGGASAPDLASRAGEEAKRKAEAPASEPALGTFVVEVTDAEWARLSTAFEAVGAGKKPSGVPAPQAKAPVRAGASEGQPGSIPAVPPVSPPDPSPAPATPPPAPPPVLAPPVPPSPAMGAPSSPPAGPPEVDAPAPTDAEAEDSAKGRGASAPPTDKAGAPPEPSAGRRRVRIVVLKR